MEARVSALINLYSQSAQLSQTTLKLDKVSHHSSWVLFTSMFLADERGRVGVGINSGLHVRHGLRYEVHEAVT